MERKLDSPLEGTKLWKLSDYEELLGSLGDLQNASDHIVVGKLEHKLKNKVMAKDGRIIKYCQRCGSSWPCLVAQEEAIERGRIRQRS